MAGNRRIVHKHEKRKDQHKQAAERRKESTESKTENRAEKEKAVVQGQSCSIKRERIRKNKRWRDKQ